MTSCHPGQAAGGQRPQKSQPAGTVLGGRHVYAQDFAVALGVDTGGDQGVHVDHSPRLSDLQDQGVGGHEGVGAGIQGRVRKASTAVSSSLAMTTTCDFDN